MRNLFHMLWLTLFGFADDLKTFVEQDGKKFAMSRYRSLRNQMIATVLLVAGMGGYGLHKASNAFTQTQVDSGRGWIIAASLAFSVLLAFVVARLAIYVAIFNGTLGALNATSRICGMSGIKTEAAKSTGKKMLAFIAWTSFVCAFAAVVPVYRNVAYLAILAITGMGLATGTAAYWEKSRFARWVLVVPMAVTFVFTVVLLFSPDLDRNVRTWTARYFGSDAAQFNRLAIADYREKIDSIRIAALQNPECNPYCSPEEKALVAKYEASIQRLQTNPEAYWQQDDAKAAVKPEIVQGMNDALNGEAPAPEAPAAPAADEPSLADKVGNAIEAVGDAAKANAEAAGEQMKASMRDSRSKSATVVSPPSQPEAGKSAAQRRAEIRARLLAMNPDLAKR